MILAQRIQLVLYQPPPVTQWDMLILHLYIPLLYHLQVMVSQTECEFRSQTGNESKKCYVHDR